MSCIAMILIFALALLADGLMDALGPGRYLLVNLPLVLLAWLLIWADGQRGRRR